MRALAVIVLAPAFALGAVAGAVGIVGGPVKQMQRPNSLVWAERVFPSKQSFEKWLRARGASYATWASRHPSAKVVFDGGDVRVLSEAPTPQPAKVSTHRKGSHSWLVALIAVGAIALLVALYARQSRLTRPASQSSSRRRAPTPGTLPRLRPRLPALAKGVSDWPVFATSATAALRRPASLVVAAHDGPALRRVRHLLPTIAFYAISIALAVVIGASVAIFLQ